MAVSTTFNVDDLSPFVEDNFEDPSDLRANPLKEGEVDAEQGTLEGSPNPNQAQGNAIAKEGQANQVLTTQIQALFSLTSPELSTVCRVLLLVKLRRPMGES